MTRQLLACGADIVEMNTIRKRLSGVKGGRFALHCTPARVEAVVLSDILGDPLAKGIGIGSASHAIGTAKALEMGETEGAMSSLATALAGVQRRFAQACC